MVYKMINLRTLINEIMTLLKFKAKLKNIELKVEIEDEIPEQFYTDPNRLK